MKEIYEHGLSFTAVLAIIIFFSKRLRKKHYERRDARYESKLDAIMKAVGAEWNGPPKPLKNEARLNLKRSFNLLRKAINQVYQRRKNMNMGSLNKTILIPIVAFIVLIVKVATGYEIPQQLIDAGTDALLAFITLIGFFIHPTIGIAQAPAPVDPISETPTPTPQPAISTNIAYPDLMQRVADVNAKLNAYYAQLKSGKETPESREAIQQYLAVHNLLSPLGGEVSASKEPQQPAGN